MGCCPFESRYKELYRDTAVLGAGDWATTRPATPTTQPREATTRPAARKGVRQRARGLAGRVCLDTKFCIVTGARDWPLGVVSRYNLSIVIGGGLVSEACHDTNDCILTGGQRLGCWGCRETGHDTALARLCAQRHDHDTAEGACDTVDARPTTRRSVIHDTVGHSRPGHSARGLCAQAGPWVAALCT